MHNELFSDAYKRMLDWIIESNTGGNVLDVSLDYLNRAQRELRISEKWTELIARSTLSITSKIATLPSDIGEIDCVYHPDSNEKPDMFYFNKSTFSSDGYREVNSGNKDAGYTKTLKFYVSPIGSVTIEYYKELLDFINSGTEYLWFTGNLMVTQAQILYLAEEGMTTTNQYKEITDLFDKFMTNFKRGHQYVNNDYRMVQRDYYGNEINTPGYNLVDGEDESYPGDSYSNSVDWKQY